MLPLEHNGYVTAAWIGIGLLAAATVAVAMQGNWLGVLLLAGFLAASVVFVRASTPRLPRLFDLLFVIAAILNAAGWVWGLYQGIPGYDEVVHFFTSFAVTLSLGFLVYRTVQEPFRDHRAHFVLVIASFGITLGAFWEIFEWMILDELPNPVVDLITDSLGAVAAGFAASWALDVQPLSDRGAQCGKSSSSQRKKNRERAAE